MAKSLKILTIKDKKEEKLLRRISTKVPEEMFKDKSFTKFLDELLQSAKDSTIPAGGIAASQVGTPLRVFYMLNYDSNEWELFINPEVEPTDYSKIESKEACLSVPNREENVWRYKNIKIKYQDRNGEKHIKKFKDLNAITIQHENDHLDGILFIDKLKK